MKTIYSFSIFIISVCLMLLSSCEDNNPDWYGAGSTPVPSQVGDSLQAHFPEAEFIEWDVVDSYYVAHFRTDGFEFVAWYTHSVAWTMTTSCIPYKICPEPVREVIDEDYRANKITIEYVSRPNFCDLYYLTDGVTDGLFASSGFEVGSGNNVPEMRPAEYPIELLEALEEEYDQVQFLDVRRVVLGWDVQFVDEENKYYHVVLDADFEILPGSTVNGGMVCANQG